MVEYRVVSIVDYGPGFRKEVFPKTPWCTDYLKVLKEQERLIEQQGDVRRVRDGIEAFIGTYKIEKREETTSFIQEYI